MSFSRRLHLHWRPSIATTLLPQGRKFATIASTPSLFKRSPAETARRIACLQLVLTRWGIEAAQKGLGNLEAQQSQEQTERIAQGFNALTEAVSQSKIDRSFTASESQIMSKPLGSWSSELTTLFPRWESLGILLWSLRIVDGIPRYHTMFPRELLFQATAIVPAFPHTVTDFIEYFTNGEGAKEHHRVSDEELREAVNRAEAWYWRAKAQVVLDLKENLKGDSEEVKTAKSKIPSGLRTVMANLDTALQQASERAVADGLIDEAAEKDFGVDGVAYRNLDDHAIRDLSDISEYRLSALSWLAGRDWDFERGELQFLNQLGSLWQPVEEN
ncbi:hypothetical protein HDU85_005660 [Gaertneriomyces sp. JEL0708]|nr:hypothetical protein HDU85_005660 [Gaertneriomyces sp. JEL0708]